MSLISIQNLFQLFQNYIFSTRLFNMLLLTKIILLKLILIDCSPFLNRKSSEMDQDKRGHNLYTKYSE
jgi:hypothetical protein